MIIRGRAIDWRAGRRLRKLPRIIQPFALLYRNLVDVLKSETLYEEKTKEKLFLGVDYIYSCAVEGDVAEFGTMSGKTSSILARAISINGRRYQHVTREPKKLHLFDSFIGLPEAASIVDKESPLVKSGAWGVGTCHGITRKTLEELCGRYLSKNRIVIYDGWFKDTLPWIHKGTKFSMVHIDCDLYQSTIEVLDHLFANQHISEGTAIFFDDYNCNKASPALGERRAWGETIEKYHVEYADCGEYGSAGWKFIVHSYRK